MPIINYVPASKREAVREAYQDQDGYWICLNEGWEASRTDAGCRTIHEDTIADLKYQIGGIQKVVIDTHKTTQAQRDAVAAWVKGRDTITLRLEKSQGAEIRAAAKAAGMSVTKFILACVHGEKSTKQTAE